MDGKITKEDLSDISKKLTSVAQLFADIWYGGHGSVYQGPQLFPTHFHFQIGPSTHGIGHWITLSYDYLWDTEELDKEVQRQYDKVMEVQKSLTCSECGHVKYPMYTNTTGS